MLAPCRRCDLVFDQGVDCFCVRHTEQGFGQTHKGDAFVGGKPVFGEENFHQSGVVVGADVPDQADGIVAECCA